MPLSATHLQFQFNTFPFPPKFISDPSSSSCLFFFPVRLSRTPIPRTQKFIVECSAAHTQTVPKSAIQRIAEKLRSLGFTEKTKTQNSESEFAQRNSAGEIFVPLPQQLPKHRTGYTVDPSWSTPENPVPQPGTGTAIVRYNELINELKKQKRLERKLRRYKRDETAPTLAELSLSRYELSRLSALGMQVKQRLKLGKAGITQKKVNEIHERWRRSEVVRIVCEDICKLNMKRTHDLLEKKTGGLVVWRAGSKIVLYRGADYKYPYFLPDKVLRSDNPIDALGDSDNDNEDSDKTNSQSSGINPVTFSDRLLMGLGPRFTDWWGYDPLPVDADRLPAVVPEYRKPFRLLPYGVRPKLTDDEMTRLKRLGRPLPCHFALGRNRKHQGLAAAIVKLWERCEIAKIAVKRGVQNTSSRIMAEELKELTGGTLLSRDHEFIVLYRGKDFLPPTLASAIKKGWRKGMYDVKLNTENSSSVTTKLVGPELKDKTVECGPDGEFNDVSCRKDRAFSKQRFVEAAIRRTSIKLSTALRKKAEAEKLLAELEKSEEYQEAEVDKEGITKEERYILRKIGLKMGPFLLLGRRGVFDGTVENMHLHWKYRELVKIICKEKSLAAVNQTACILEAESGGILVAVERVNKGYAIIMYRGKNYSIPAGLRPQTLLNKKKALKRSKEAQRCESLKLHILKLNKNIDELKRQLDKDKKANSKQIANASRYKLASEKRGTCLTSVKMNSQKAAPSINSQEEMPQVELTDDGGACQGEPELLVGSINTDTQASLFKASEKRGACLTSVNTNSQKAAPVSSQELLQVELTDDDGARQGEPEFLVGSINIDTRTSLFKNSEKRGGCLTSVNMNSQKAAPVNGQEEMPQVELTDDDGARQGEPELLVGSINTDTQTSLFKTSEKRGGCLTSVNMNSQKAAPVNGQEEMPQVELTDDDGAHQGEPELLVRSINTDTQLVRKNANEFRSRSVYLSNKERLLLRREALKHMELPVLSIGENNIMTGVARAIRTYFQKYPLAIVDIKGRAKGTSFQEVVFKLEQATGGVLISQEPSKIILYRGWGLQSVLMERIKRGRKIAKEQIRRISRQNSRKNVPTENFGGKAILSNFYSRSRKSYPYS